MKKIIVFIIFTILITMAGCSNKDVIKKHYVFTGENELWECDFKVDSTDIFYENEGTLEYEGDSDKVLTVTYKKDLSDLSTVKNIEISYKSGLEGGKVSKDYNYGPPTEKTFTLTFGGSGGTMINEDEVIEVTISVDGVEQFIELKASAD